MTLTLPQGKYRFRTDKEGQQYCSGANNHCTIPGCLQAAITLPGGAASTVTKTITYTYDSLYRLTAADYDSGEYFHYTYDDVGNRLTEEKKTSPAGLVESTSYTYDDANRMLTAGGVTYTWDNNGNMLSDGTNTYTYNHANRLTSIVQGASTITFTYNGLGDRLSETINGVTIIFTLDLNTGLTQVLSDGSHVYLYGLGRIAQVSGSESAYFLGDALGSVRQLADGQGTVILARAYEPYGSVMSTAGEDATKYGFTGEWQDGGIVFLRARYYTPGTGLFFSRDSWEGDANQPSSLNKWAYVVGNPVNIIDPSGHIPCTKPSSRGERSMYCELLAGVVRRQAQLIKDEVTIGSLLPVEGFAQLVDYAFIESGYNYWGMIWALTAVIDDFDGDNNIPVWLQAWPEADMKLKTTEDYSIGQNWLPYKANPKRNLDDWGFKGRTWVYSERGDWNPWYWDQTANQAFHFWFFPAVTYFDGMGFAVAANVRHELVDPFDFISSVTHDYFKNPPDRNDPPPPHEQSLPDYLLGIKGIQYGLELKRRDEFGIYFKELMACHNYVNKESLPGEWIRNNLR